MQLLLLLLEEPKWVMVVLGQPSADLERKIEYFEVKEKEHIKLCFRQAWTLNNNNKNNLKGQGLF